MKHYYSYLSALVLFQKRGRYIRRSCRPFRTVEALAAAGSDVIDLRVLGELDLSLVGPSVEATLGLQGYVGSANVGSDIGAGFVLCDSPGLQYKRQRGRMLGGSCTRIMYSCLGSISNQACASA